MSTTIEVMIRIKWRKHINICILLAAHDDPLIDKDSLSVLMSSCLSLSEQRADLWPRGLQSHDRVAELRRESHSELSQPATTVHEAPRAHWGGPYDSGMTKKSSSIFFYSDGKFLWTHQRESERQILASKFFGALFAFLKSPSGGQTSWKTSVKLSSPGKVLENGMICPKEDCSGI